MERITIRVHDKKKARVLMDLLESLDFVASVDLANDNTRTTGAEDEKVREEAFFAAAGIWEGRNVTQESLRASAWPFAITWS